MRKTLILLFLTIGLVSCGNGIERENTQSLKTKIIEEDEKIQVTTSIVPLASITNYIGGESVEVNNLVGVGVSPHGFGLTPQNMINIQKSDIVFLFGIQDIDGFLFKSLSGVKSIALDVGLQVLDATSEHDHSEHDHSDHAGEHSDDEHSDDEHSDDEHSDDEHSDDEHSDDEHSDDEHSDDEHSDDEHSDDEHSDDEHSDDEHSDDEHSDDEHSDDEHSDDEHSDDEHSDDEHSDDEHSDDEHSDDEHSDDEHSDDEHSDDEHSDDEEINEYQYIIDAQENHDHNKDGIPDHTSNEHSQGEEYMIPDSNVNKYLAEEGEGHVHAEASIDPHVWGGKVNSLIIANKIKEELSKLKPSKKTMFEENYASFEKELTKTFSDFTKTIEGKNQKEFILFHDAYNYLLFDAGIDMEKKLVFRKNVMNEPNSTAMKKLIDEVTLHGIDKFYIEPQFQSKALSILAQENGAEILKLDPLGSSESSKGFLENIQSNLQALSHIYE